MTFQARSSEEVATTMAKRMRSADPVAALGTIEQPRHGNRRPAGRQEPQPRTS